MSVPWTARRPNQSILKEINPECLLEGLFLKLQYFGHLMQRADSLEKTLMLRKTESRRRREQKRMRQLDGITNSMDMLLLLLLSRFSCVRLLATPWTAAYQGPPSMGFSRQEYWSGLPLPSPSMDMSLSKLREIVKDWEAWWAVVHGVKKNRTRLHD